MWLIAGGVVVTVVVLIASVAAAAVARWMLEAAPHGAETDARRRRGRPLAAPAATAIVPGRSRGRQIAAAPGTRVLAVCGAGMGSSLILRRTAEQALEPTSASRPLTHTDVCSARGATPDVVVAQPTYLERSRGLAPVMVPIESFVVDRETRAAARERSTNEGWL